MTNVFDDFSFQAEYCLKEIVFIMYRICEYCFFIRFPEHYFTSLSANNFTFEQRNDSLFLNEMHLKRCELAFGLCCQ